MEKELIKKAAELFDSSVKWDSFLELITLQSKIINNWHSERDEAVKNKIKLPVGWALEVNQDGFHWYIEELGVESIGIWFEDNTNISLCAPIAIFNIESIKINLQTNKYNQISDVMPYSNKILFGEYLLQENGKFEFDSIHDNNFNTNNLAWFAGNQTEKFIAQLQSKLDKFFNLKELIMELNKKFKIPQ